MMRSEEIRSLFLNFFERKGHKVMPSSSLIPFGDPTLLFTTAGMVQFKPYFLGEAIPPSPRLTSCQKCFRTTDIDAIGDHKHLTFFEMLGNFSFGDYFKKEAISWAWEFVTEVLKLPPERLWVTIYKEDEEAFDIWRRIGIYEERIKRFGEEDNFWGPAGEWGPCGPCSEIHYDFGEEYGCGRADCGPNCSCPRFLEIWNLVFIQYNQDREGKRTPLAKPCIDTGMGLERVAAVMQGKTSVYETDLFIPLIERICKIAGYSYGMEEEKDKAVRIIAEHSRGIAFLIADGIFPSNEGRGYVLRKILRRARLYAHKLGLEELCLAPVVDEVISIIGEVYPELSQNRNSILKITEVEENRFIRTLERGLELLEGIIKKIEIEGGKEIKGEDVFMLYDTYGFPYELTTEITKLRGLSIDLEGFKAEMEKQRERARAAQRFGLRTKEEAYRELGLSYTPFLGYETLHNTSVIIGLLVGGKPVETANKGQEVEIILAETSFYGEMGGQVGDSGIILSPRGKVVIHNAIRPLPELIVHLGEVEEGQISLGDKVIAEVDKERRLDIARNHTATHLLQSALRQVLGSHVYQRGSLVSPNLLRFDFSHPSPLTEEEIDRIQSLVNEKIRQNLPVCAEDLPYKEALKRGAIALFGEKYGEVVRMVEIEGFSRELCGGTHVKSTGEIGFFIITKEEGIGVGLRRIEALTGRWAEANIKERLFTLKQIAHKLKASPEEIESKVSSLISQLEEASKKVLSLERRLLRETADRLLNQVELIGEKKFLSAEVSVERLEALGELADILKEKLKSGVIVLGTTYENRPHFLVAITSDLVSQGLHADEIAKRMAKVVGGGGGGRPHFARAGGKDKTKIKEALQEARNVLIKS